MNSEDSVAVGVGALVAIVVASGIFWWTLWRLLRWVVT